MAIILKLRRENSVLVNENREMQILKHTLTHKEVLIKSYSELQKHNNAIIASKISEIAVKKIEISTVNTKIRIKCKELELVERELSLKMSECNELERKIDLIKKDLHDKAEKVREKNETIKAADQRVKILESQLDDENCCSICFAKYDESENAHYCIKTCGHQACSQCLDNILRNSRACHICRKTFQLKNIMQLY